MIRRIDVPLLTFTPKLTIKNCLLDRALSIVSADVAGILDKMCSSIIEPKKYRYVDVKYQRAGSIASNQLWHFDLNVVPSDYAEMFILVSGHFNETTKFLNGDYKIPQNSDKMQVHNYLKEYESWAYNIAPDTIYSYREFDAHKGPGLIHHNRILIRLINTDKFIDQRVYCQLKE